MVVEAKQAKISQMHSAGDCGGGDDIQLPKAQGKQF